MKRTLALCAALLMAIGSAYGAADVAARSRASEYGATSLAANGLVLQPLSGYAFTIAGPAETLRSCCSVEQLRIACAGAELTAADISAIGEDAQVVGFRGWRTPVPLAERRIHVLLASPLEAAASCLVQLEPAFNLGRRQTLVFAPPQRSLAIQVNQLGFHPGQRKYAYVGAWLGTAGPMPIRTTRFDVVGPDDQVAYEGTLILRSRADPWSGNDVWEADFSALQRPGQYRVRVAGIGSSDSFPIVADPYREAYQTVMRVLYHSRNSTAIESPWAWPGHERKGGIRPELDGTFDPRVGTSPLGRGERPDDRHPVARGWFDAGDYGQYVPNAAPLWFVVSLGMDLDPGAFADGDLGIPESGNGVPDVLDELDWGFEWARSMQDPHDGGVYFRIASLRWDDGLPSSVLLPRLIAEKTTHATASFAALAAIHARLLESLRPERAQQAAAAAEKAWAFLASHPAWPEEGARYRNRPGVSAGEYSDTSSLDNRLWAAAELFRLTRREEYLDFYEQNFSRVPLDPTGEVSYSQQAMAAVWTYLSTDDDRRAPALVESARRAVLAGADWRVRQMEAHPFRAPIHPDRALVGWGSFGHSARAVLSLAAAYRLTGDGRYRLAAWDAPAPQFGANPLALSFVTGLGVRSPRYPLSKLSQYSRDGSALPGLPVNGPFARLPTPWPSTRAVVDGYGPAAELADGYPVLRRYTDARHLPPMNEPTVAEVARIGIALALLRDAGPLAAATGTRLQAQQ